MNFYYFTIKSTEKSSSQRGSNSRPFVYEANALPPSPCYGSHVRRRHVHYLNLIFTGNYISSPLSPAQKKLKLEDSNKQKRRCKFISHQNVVPQIQNFDLSKSKGA